MGCPGVFTVLPSSALIPFLGALGSPINPFKPYLERRSCCFFAATIESGRNFAKVARIPVTGKLTVIAHQKVA